MPVKIVGNYVECVISRIKLIHGHKIRDDSSFLYLMEHLPGGLVFCLVISIWVIQSIVNGNGFIFLATPKKCGDSNSFDHIMVSAAVLETDQTSSFTVRAI